MVRGQPLASYGVCLGQCIPTVAHVLLTSGLSAQLCTMCFPCYSGF